MDLNIANIGLAGLQRIVDLWRGSKSDSLIDYTSSSRVEPIVLIDSSIIYDENMSAIQQSLLSIFSGYYLQAWSMSATIGNIDVARNLDKLNPSRNPLDSAVDTGVRMASLESYKYRLPSNYTKSVSLEAIRDEIEKPTTVDVDTNVITKIIDAPSNLSVGKLLKVEICQGMHTGSVMVSVRLMANAAPPSALVDILAAGDVDMTVKERWYGWREGRLDTVRDMLLCNDLIDAHRKNLMKDKTGIYGAILNRARKNQMAALVSANPSVATASNIAVISSETAHSLESKINGKLSNFKLRSKLFDKSNLMLIVIYDQQWGRVKIYHRGIDHASDLSIKDIKTATKGSGPDISDILKAYQLGNSPTL